MHGGCHAFKNAESSHECLVAMKRSRMQKVVVNAWRPPSVQDCKKSINVK